jgi:hypothetical protein
MSSAIWSPFAVGTGVPRRERDMLASMLAWLAKIQNKTG